DMPPHVRSEVEKWVENEGKLGKRIIAVGKKSLISRLENLAHDEKGLEFVGLVSFVDPLKKTAQAAIKRAGTLGVQIKILTGDSKEVAGAVAFQSGLIQNPSDVITGDQFDALSSSEQHNITSQYSVFARVSPEQKHQIIQLLQERYEVGFLGEGINDAPALKVANVAIVVQEASDIAREAADIVLLNKSLHVVIDGIKEGREIFGNTAKYIKATLASNLGNFYTVAIASLFITFLPLLPLQILLINLLTDFPMIAVATDNVDGTELKRPRNYDVKEIALFATVMGIVSSIVDFLFFALFFRISPQVLQTNWFIGSVLTELVFLFSIRTRLPILKATPPSIPLITLSGVAFLTSIILPFTTLGHIVFEFITPNMHYIILILIITGGYFITTEVVKLMYYRFVNGKNNNFQ
ncbi:MAG TPA: HAD-IC family P-type ATPase, partial [Candidatus Woesebacteria bacterium]|nr:HAD-IC family P-type ATPase [Candidatus Woesebacteria bacterium]